MKKTFKEFIKKMVMPITVSVKAGPIKDYKVIAASGMKFIKGRYELPMIEFLEKNLNEGDTCLDVGGHVGYLSLVMSKLIGDTGQVFTFEPRPINIAYIEKHLSSNNISNIKLFTTGISNQKGNAKFDLNTGTGVGRITNSGNLEIPITTLDLLLEQGEITPPNFIKMDIEGEEVNALAGAEKLLRQHKPLLNISTHGSDIRNQCEAFLIELGYEILHTDAKDDLIAQSPS